LNISFIHLFILSMMITLLATALRIESKCNTREFFRSVVSIGTYETKIKWAIDMLMSEKEHLYISDWQQQKTRESDVFFSLLFNVSEEWKILLFFNWSIIQTKDFCVIKDKCQLLLIIIVVFLWMLSLFPKFMKVKKHCALLTHLSKCNGMYKATSLKIIVWIERRMAAVYQIYSLSVLIILSVVLPQITR